MCLLYLLWGSMNYSNTSWHCSAVESHWYKADYFSFGYWYSGSMGRSRAIEKLMYSWSQRLVYYLSSDFCYSVCWQTKLTPEKISQALCLLVTKLPDLLFLFFLFLVTVFLYYILTISSRLGDFFSLLTSKVIFVWLFFFLFVLEKIIVI